MDKAGLRLVELTYVDDFTRSMYYRTNRLLHYDIFCMDNRCCGPWSRWNIRKAHGPTGESTSLDKVMYLRHSIYPIKAQRHIIYDDII